MLCDDGGLLEFPVALLQHLTMSFICVRSSDPANFTRRIGLLRFRSNPRQQLRRINRQSRQYAQSHVLVSGNPSTNFQTNGLLSNRPTDCSLLSYSSSFAVCGLSCYFRQQPYMYDTPVDTLLKLRLINGFSRPVDSTDA